MDIDLALCVDKLTVPTESNFAIEKLAYEWWKKSNILSLMLIKCMLARVLYG